MSTLAPMPLSKARQPLSPFGSGADAPEEPLVLIRLRDLNARQEVESEESVDAPTSEQVAEEANGSDSQSNAALGNVLATMLKASPPAEPKPTTEIPATPEEAPAQSAESTIATPSRRQRQRRETPPAKRDWSNTVWQGTVGLLLVSMVIIVYFIMAGGGKKGTAGPAGAPTTEEHRSPEELETPEISIPEAGQATTELSEADFPGKPKTPPSDDPALESPAHASPESARETEDVAREFAAPSTDGERSRDPANTREASRPRTETANYPVTPATATYPVTDPNRFRYPDDTRPSGAPAKRPPAGTAGLPDVRCSQGPLWNENERLGGGSGGGEFQPATKMR